MNILSTGGSNLDYTHTTESRYKMIKSHSKPILVTSITNNKMTKYSSIKEAGLHWY